MKNIKSLSMLMLGASAVATINTVSADVVHLDDVIVSQSLCVGNDCVNGESFGFDTVRVKENNLRIHFDDTSTSASFPSNDWRIKVNDSANGGGNYFAIEDSSAGRDPFRVDAGAPANALRVDSAGDVGIGVSNPVVDLHVKSGNTPTLRLEQDGSSGFTPQTFDVASNEANFFIRDATNGSKLFFRAEPGAPQDSMYIENTGNIGLGTSSPERGLHIRRTDANITAVRVENTNATTQNVDIHLKNTISEWRMRNNTVGDFVINDVGDTGFEFELAQDGTLTLQGGLITGTAGNCTIATPCDRVFDTSVFQVKPIDIHAEEMWNNQYLGAVGPTKPNQPINITQKTTGILHELEVAHIYIEQLHKRLGSMEERLAEIEAEK